MSSAKPAKNEFDIAQLSTGELQRFDLSEAPATADFALLCACQVHAAFLAVWLLQTYSGLRTPLYLSGELLDLQQSLGDV